MKLSHLAFAGLAVLVAAAPVLSPTVGLAAEPAKPVGQTWTVGSLVLSGAYARATLPHAPVGGGFIAITNNGSADDTLVSATSPASDNVELHQMSMSNGVMQMREMPDGVAVPAGKTVTFSPSGLHLMFTPLKTRFVQGKTVPVTLTFAKAGSVTVDLLVGGIAASAPPGAAPATSGDMSGMKM